MYAWDYHKKTGYDWWMKRVACCFKLYDIIRIDHFRGFDEYYAIPYGDETAENGEWMPGPGMDLFRTMKETLGDASDHCGRSGIPDGYGETIVKRQWLSGNESTGIRICGRRGQ